MGCAGALTLGIAPGSAGVEGTTGPDCTPAEEPPGAEEVAAAAFPDFSSALRSLDAAESLACDPGAPLAGVRLLPAAGAVLAGWPELGALDAAVPLVEAGLFPAAAPPPGAWPEFGALGAEVLLVEAGLLPAVGAVLPAAGPELEVLDAEALLIAAGLLPAAGALVAGRPEFEALAVEALLAEVGLLPPAARPESVAFDAAESVLAGVVEPVVLAPDLPGVAPAFSAGVAAPLAVGAAVPGVPLAGMGRVGAPGREPATGLRSVVASGRASASAGVAGTALSRAGFLSSFGSDTHYPSLRRNSLNSTASLTGTPGRSPTSDRAWPRRMSVDRPE